MSISVQQLVQTAFQNCSLIGDGESVDGTAYGTTAHDGALGLLNNLLSELNNQGFIASTQMYQEAMAVPFGDIHLNGLGVGVTIIGSSGNPYPEVGYILCEFGAPEKLNGVSRKIGDRWLPLASCNIQQMMTRTMKSLATSWTYDLREADYPNHNDAEMYGRISLDTHRPTQIRFFYNSKIRVQNLPNEVLQLSDIYFDLLLNGLCVKLCVKYKLTDYLPIFEQQFKQAKNLIKRSNATQRMLQRGDLGGGYNDSFYNGLGGVGW